MVVGNVIDIGLIIALHSNHTCWLLLVILPRTPNNSYCSIFDSIFAALGEGDFSAFDYSDSLTRANQLLQVRQKPQRTNTERVTIIGAVVGVVIVLILTILIVVLGSVIFVKVR